MTASANTEGHGENKAQSVIQTENNKNLVNLLCRIQMLVMTTTVMMQILHQEKRGMMKIG